MLKDITAIFLTLVLIWKFLLPGGSLSFLVPEGNDIHIVNISCNKIKKATATDYSYTQFEDSRLLTNLFCYWNVYPQIFKFSRSPSEIADLHFFDYQNKLTSLFLKAKSPPPKFA
jgi:hypothetical protein